MCEKNPFLDFLTYFILILGILAIGLPVYYSFVASTLTLEEVTQVPMPLIPGNQFFHNIKSALSQNHIFDQMINSFIMATGITVGKITISCLSAFAITFFNFKLRQVAFWMIFFTLMLPVQVRILPTYEVAANIFYPLQKIMDLFNVEITIQWSLLDSYPGLILPLIASATATFLFRQFFLTIPSELIEAAKMDGATPMQFFRKIILPLSKTNIAALIVIIFIYGWNQYLWPLLITTKPDMKTVIIGIQQLIPDSDEIPAWHIANAGCMLVLIPPICVVIFMQKWFVKGLIENEK